MFKRSLLFGLTLAALGLSVPEASAANHGAYSGMPFGFGFYQPYGVRYSTSVRTPPYFAVNPPVYYGGRHYRPYGASPFASLPLVDAGSGYHTRAADRAMRVPQMSKPIANPYCEDVIANKGVDEPVADVAAIKKFVPGAIQVNPFASHRLAATGSTESSD